MNYGQLILRATHGPAEKGEDVREGTYLITKYVLESQCIFLFENKDKKGSKFFITLLTTS